MKIKDILLEYNRKITIDKFGERLFHVWITGPDKMEFYVPFSSSYEVDKKETQEKAINLLIDKFENADPTPNKMYTPWIAINYGKGKIKRLEDLTRVRNALSIYHKNKQNKEFIEHCKFIKNNIDLTKPVKDSDIKNIFNIDFDLLEAFTHAYKKTPEIVNKGNSKVVYEDDDIRVIQPLDEQAACYYGQGTRWCTASTESENYFDDYNSRGPLYIILNKTPGKKQDKYQLHIESGQFMDKNDDPLHIEFLIKSHPKFVDWLLNDNPNEENKQNTRDMFFFADEDTVKKLWDLCSNSINYIMPKIEKRINTIYSGKIPSYIQTMLNQTKQLPTKAKQVSYEEILHKVQNIRNFSTLSLIRYGLAKVRMVLMSTYVIWLMNQMNTFAKTALDANNDNVSFGEKWDKNRKAISEIKNMVENLSQSLTILTKNMSNPNLPNKIVLGKVGNFTVIFLH